MTPDEFMKKAREIGGTPDAVSWQWADLYREAKATLGERTIKQITEAEDWPGPSYPVFKELGRVGKRFPPVVRSRYLDLLPLGFTKWQAVTSVKNDDTAVFLLTNALHFGWTVPKLRGERSRILSPYADMPLGVDIGISIEQQIALGKKFRVVYGDLPWPWDHEDKQFAGSGKHYKSMTLDAMCALRVPELVTDDAYLFLWSPAALFPKVVGVLNAWGFEYRTNIVWYKINGPGCGYLVLTRHEHLIIARRPNAPKQFSEKPPSVIEAPRGKHSEKPECVYGIIERAVQGPFLELFGRGEPRKGWTVIGNQVAPDSDDRSSAD